MVSSPLGVRKGAWTEEEDNLLRECIGKYGEGKWNLVPLRAGIASAYTEVGVCFVSGRIYTLQRLDSCVLDRDLNSLLLSGFDTMLSLTDVFRISFFESPCLNFLLSVGLNRCRKSCRMRWLNYLTPNIKRGDFTRDEDDLIIRLHKLLGNRWSLIAGRIPGRTANDVKNHWNTRLQRKLVAQKEDTDNSQKITKSTNLKPQPRTFSKTMACSMENSTFEPNIRINENSSSPKVIEGSIKWWNNLLDTKENGDEGTPLSNGLSLGFLEGGWEDFCNDKNIWEILSSDQTLMQ